MEIAEPIKKPLWLAINVDPDLGETLANRAEQNGAELIQQTAEICLPFTLDGGLEFTPVVHIQVEDDSNGTKALVMAWYGQLCKWAAEKKHPVELTVFVPKTAEKALALFQGSLNPLPFASVELLDV